MVEEWKQIGDTDYLVSNLGRVYSNKSNKILRTQTHRNGYVTVWISTKDGNKTPTLHRLVAEAFVPNPSNKPQVNHIDGNKQNNCASNLEWVTQSENTIHAYKLGLQKLNHRNCKHKLYYNDICIVFDTVKELCEFTNVGIDRIKYSRKNECEIGIGEYKLYKVKTIYV